MPAYLVGNVQVTDAAAYEDYRSKVPAVIAAHGGRYLVRGGATEVLEGDAPAHRIVVLEFPDMASLRAFYFSEAYKPLLALRKRAAISSITLVEGV